MCTLCMLFSYIFQFLLQAEGTHVIPGHVSESQPITSSTGNKDDDDDDDDDDGADDKFDNVGDPERLKAFNVSVCYSILKKTAFVKA
jgi:hypothetical protein